jgi:hypothetical protein
VDVNSGKSEASASTGTTFPDQINFKTADKSVRPPA